jgi:hypothetical protein
MIRGIGIVIAVIAVILVAVAAADFSTRTATCMACHTREASFADWMGHRLKAQKKGFSHELIACAACHMEGGAQGTLMSGFRGLLHVVTYLVPQIDPRRPRVSGLFTQTRIPSQNCQYCHYGSLYKKAVSLKDLSPGLKKIGLVMDHRKHVLERDDTCAQCHERYKAKLAGKADKEVAYTEVNHLGCDSCHTYASHAYRSGRLLPLTEKKYREVREKTWHALSVNPRWMVAIPSEKTCSRCHDGKIHFKKRIFNANCRTGDKFENCVKCHPLMTRQYFEEYRRERHKLSSVSAQRDTDG